MRKNKIIKAKTNDRDKKIKEIRKILDSKYFHVCTEIKENDEILWSIFYSNLPTEVYFSYKNKPLLTSKENTISDIYKLKNKFESEKKKILAKNAREYTLLRYLIFNSMLEVKKKFAETMLDIILGIVLVVIINMLFLQDITISIVFCILTTFIAILTVIKDKTIEKLIQEKQKDVKEIYIREKIGKEGLYFVERLKK